MSQKDVGGCLFDHRHHLQLPQREREREGGRERVGIAHGEGDEMEGTLGPSAIRHSIPSIGGGGGGGGGANPGLYGDWIQGRRGRKKGVEEK